MVIFPLVFRLLELELDFCDIGPHLLAFIYISAVKKFIYLFVFEFYSRHTGEYKNIFPVVQIVGENTQQLAVELDTYENDFDLDGNRVGINTTSASEPVAAKSLCTSGVELKSGRKLTVIIRYNGSKKSLYVYVQYVGNPSKKILKQHIDISNIVPSSICRIHC